jgi:hypothetical protein
VLEAFGVLHKAFPQVLRTDAPLQQSQVLVELMADDRARKATSDTALARAIVALAGGTTPAGALGAGGEALIRLQRLNSPASNRWAMAASLGISAFVLIAPTVFIAIPWMLHAWQTLV